MLSVLLRPEGSENNKTAGDIPVYLTYLQLDTKLKPSKDMTTCEDTVYPLMKAALADSCSCSTRPSIKDPVSGFIDIKTIDFAEDYYGGSERSVRLVSKLRSKCMQIRL